MNYDISFIRSQFPAFSQPEMEGWAFFENAGGSFVCKQVIEKMTKYLTHNRVQPYYNFPIALDSGEKMDETYRRMAEFLGVKSSEVLLGPSSTQNLYVLARAFRPLWDNEDEIIVSCQDHEANAGSWRKLADTGITVKEWHVNQETGLLETDDLDLLITPRTKLIAYPHCSNVVGHINPVNKISEIARMRGIITVVDGVAMAPHGFPDISELKTDIYLFSLYKTWGPHQGLMVVDEDLLDRLENQSHFFKKNDIRSKLIPAGPDHAQIAASSGIIDYFETIYDYHFSDVVEPIVKNHFISKLIRGHEKKLVAKLMDFLQSRDDLQIIGPTDPEIRVPTISVSPLKKDPIDLIPKLADHKCMVSSGHFYSVRTLKEMKIDLNRGILRMSFLHYTSMEDIAQLIKALEKVLD